jgi:hypothetical protein
LELWRFFSAVWLSTFNGSTHIESEPANQREKKKKTLFGGLSRIGDQHMKTDTRLNPTTNATEAIDKQQLKQLATSFKDVLSSLTMDIHCPKHVGVF